jgi:hypothetical protein
VSILAGDDLTGVRIVIALHARAPDLYLPLDACASRGIDQPTFDHQFGWEPQDDFGGRVADGHTTGASTRPFPSSARPARSTPTAGC